MGVLALLGVALLAINCLSSMAMAKPQGIGIGSKLSLGPLGSIGSGFNFQPGGGDGARTEGSTTPETTSNEESYGVNSNLGIGKAGSIGSGFNFQPGPALKKTSPGSNTTAVTRAATTVSTTAVSPAAERSDDFGLNTNLGLGKAGSINSGLNFKKPGSERSETTTTQSNNIGFGGNLGLGKAGSVGSGVSFKPGTRQQKVTPARGKAVTPSKNREEVKTTSATSTATTSFTSTTTTTPVINRQDDSSTTVGAEVTTTTSRPGWSNWGEWTECSTTCGFGLHKRNRTCEGGSPCFGLPEELKGCSNKPCTLALGLGLGGSGEWSEWSNWTDCSANCGVGSQTRSRTCNGESCFGPAEMRQACVQSPCPQGEWGEWSEWDQCSTTCGFGLQKRTRACEGGICPGLTDMQRACPFKAC
uniref:Uncharacterized protein n=1 Tax=Plectus sambesii TaxID=2011161 RepID=A0A914WHL3_9BILA